MQSKHVSVASTPIGLELGHALTIWTARISAALYVYWVLLLHRRRWTRARLVSTVALSAYVLHVVCSFEYFYSWSHALAYRETARQTAALYGVTWGGGLYLNYLFTGVWLADCAMSWLQFDAWRARPGWIGAALHSFLCFMFVNATAVVWFIQALR